MNPDISQAIAVELGFALKRDWVATETANQFRVSPSAADRQLANFPRVLREEVWRVAQFIAYAHFVSIQQIDGGGYLLVSKNSEGNGFQVQFEAT